jgi:hypothetical protein
MSSVILNHPLSKHSDQHSFLKFAAGALNPSHNFPFSCKIAAPGKYKLQLTENMHSDGPFAAPRKQNLVVFRHRM